MKSRHFLQDFSFSVCLGLRLVVVIVRYCVVQGDGAASVYLKLHMIPVT